MKATLHARYIYSFYSFDELLGDGVFEDEIEVSQEKRFTLHQQEDASFIVSELKEDFMGKYVIVTYPNKDNVLVYQNDETELLYDEFYDAMGDSNHNVYEGSFSLTVSE